VLERFQVPLGPVVLGLVLGGPLEESFLQTLTASASPLRALFGRPIAATLAVLAILLWVSPLLAPLLRGRRRGARPIEPSR
jgi:TctA family transporter